MMPPTKAQALILGTLTRYRSHIRVTTRGAGWLHRKDCTFAYEVRGTTLAVLISNGWLDYDREEMRAAGTGETIYCISEAGAIAAVHPKTGRFTYLEQSGTIVISARRRV